MSRTVIRSFAIIVILVMVLDTLPNSWSFLSLPKRGLSFVLNRVGLWQGEWSMFAPDPVINNGWLTAELTTKDGRSIQWDSPHWSKSGIVDKFVRFRHINYYNRLPLLWNLKATDDFMDYLARQSGQEIARVKLYRNHMRLQMPEDGSLPVREEAEWQFLSELWVQREITP